MQPRGATSTLNMKYYRRDICSILEHKHLLDCIKRRNKSWEDQGRQMLDGVHQLQHLVWEVSREKRQHTRARLAYMDGYSRGVEHLDYLEAKDEYKSIIWLHTINVVEVGGGICLGGASNHQPQEDSKLEVSPNSQQGRASNKKLVSWRHKVEPASSRMTIPYSRLARANHFTN